MDDDRLAFAAARGDGEAFSQLVKRYRPYVYTIAYKIVLNPEDALDVTQNLFLKLFQNLGAYREQGSFRAWLAALTARAAIDHVRAAKSGANVIPLDDPDRHKAEQEAPWETLDRDNRLQRIEEAAARLSAQQRAIITLRLREDLGPNEIAVRLEIPSGQVRSQYHRAIAKLRRVLGQLRNESSSMECERPRPYSDNPPMERERPRPCVENPPMERGRPRPCKKNSPLRKDKTNEESAQ